MAINLFQKRPENAPFGSFVLLQWLDRIANRHETTEYPLFYVGSTTRDMSTASGTQTITGVPFKPRCMVFIMGTSTPGANSSIGVDDGTTAICLYDAQAVAPDSNGIDTDASIHYEASGGDQQGHVTSFTDDGFVITWVKTTLPTGTATIGYLALR